MNIQTPSHLRLFYETTILPYFLLPDGVINWQGDSELDSDSYASYFSIKSINYLLVLSTVHNSKDIVEGAAIAPHESAITIYPKVGTYRDVYIDDSSSSPRETGYFSLYEIRSPITQR